MRYLAGFIGGVVVAVLLLVFQLQLIAGDGEYVPQPAPAIQLDSVFKSRPPETIDRAQRKAPPKPEPIMDRLPSPKAPDVPPVRPLPVKLSAPGVSGGGPVVIPGSHGDYPSDGGPGLRSAVQPQYPYDALRNNIEGEVELEFTVLADGSVADVVVIRANPRGVFEQSAVRAVSRWQFMPKRENGVGVPVRVRQVVEFELP